MSHSQDRWIAEALAEARQIEPTDAEIVPALVRIAARSERDRWKPTRDWRRLMTLSRRTFALAFATILLLAAAAMAMGLINAPFVDNKGAPPAREGSAKDSADVNAPEPAGDEAEPPPAVATSGGGPLSEEEEAAVETSTHLYDAIRDVGVDRGHTTAKVLCDLMTDEAIEQTKHYSRVSSGQGDIEWNCQNSVRYLVLRTQHNSRFGERVLEAKVVGVNVEGGNATVTVRSGGEGGHTVSFALVKHDGEWKLAATPVGP